MDDISSDDGTFYDANNNSTSSVSTNNRFNTAYLASSWSPRSDAVMKPQSASPDATSSRRHSSDSPHMLQPGQAGSASTANQYLSPSVMTRRRTQPGQQYPSPGDNFARAPDMEPTSSQDKKPPSKKGFLERIGLKRTKKSQSTNAKSPTEHHHPHEVEDDNASDNSFRTSSSSASSAPVRQSIESGRSMAHSTATANTHTTRERSNTIPHDGIPVKIKSKTKSAQGFRQNIILAQTITLLPRHQTVKETTGRRPSRDALESTESPGGAIWAMKFSKDGKYLAAAGQSGVLYVYKVLDGEDTREGETIHVVDETPIREYRAHTADILDIAWSKNNFIVSASMDKMVRLWHISRPECLCVFRHLDVVTSICFHPKDDRFFLSGSLDGRLRLWSISDKKVAFWNDLPDNNMITAVGFTLDGKTACVGSQIGQCFFYETQGLKYNTQVAIGTSRRNKKGRKVTGIEAMPGMPPGEEKLLVTSNDSRIRLINMKDKSLMYKYKGAHNMAMQIRAAFSDDGEKIVCGSDDGNIYIWITDPITFSPFQQWLGTQVTLNHFGESGTSSNSSMHGNHHRGVPAWLKRHDAHDKQRSHSEHFEAHRHTATVGVFAPGKTRQLLAQSGRDIIYNHTPLVNMRSSGASSSSDRWADEDTSRLSMRRSFSLGSDLHEDADMLRDKGTYPYGAILVSANDTGCIKIWRVDSGVYDGSVHAQPSSHPRPKSAHRKSGSLDLVLMPDKSVSSSESKGAGGSSPVRRGHLGNLFSASGGR